MLAHPSSAPPSAPVSAPLSVAAASALVDELHRRELVVAAVAEQLERAMQLVASTAHDPRWRGPAARAFGGAVERNLHGLLQARRSLDVAGFALTGRRWSAEQQLAEARARAASVPAVTGG